MYLSVQTIHQCTTYNSHIQYRKHTSQYKQYINVQSANQHTKSTGNITVSTPSTSNVLMWKRLRAFSTETVPLSRNPCITMYKGRSRSRSCLSFLTRIVIVSDIHSHQTKSFGTQKPASESKLHSLPFEDCFYS